MIEIFNLHRGLLFGIAYRMLGRVSEAEDMMQEVWLRWQKQDAAAIQSAKAWLVSTTTRLCIDQLRLARREREDYYGIWLPEPLAPITDKNPAQSAELGDSLSLAFMLMLESLDPPERAVFLLREVFDYDYADIAAIVDKSEANCRQIVSRAKTSLRAGAKPTSPPTEQARRLVEEFLAAAASGNMDEVLALLAEDSTVLSDGGGRVRAAGRVIEGADHVSRFLLGIWPRFMTGVVPQRVDVNGSPGFLVTGGGQVHYAYAFDIVGDRVQSIYIMCNPDKLRHLTGAR